MSQRHAQRRPSASEGERCELASDPLSQPRRDAPAERGAGARRNVLVAGIGNVFLSDDGFGVEVVRALHAGGAVPDGVEVVDTGIRGMHLAYQLLDGYDALVIVDAIQRGSAPGTLYTLEHDLDAARSGPVDGSGPEAGSGPAFDAHGMDPLSVLDQLDTLASSMGIERPVGRVLVVGCEPAVLDEAIGLSPPVASAVQPAVRAVLELVSTLAVPEGVL